MKKKQIKTLTPDQKKLAALRKKLKDAKEELSFKAQTLEDCARWLAEEEEKAKKLKAELDRVKQTNENLLKSVRNYVSASVEIVNLANFGRVGGCNCGQSVHKIRPNILDGCTSLGEKKY